jgi:adenylate cyclase
MDMHGMAMMYAGDAEAGLRECKRALEANPRFPANNWFMDSMAIGNFLREDYGAAVEWARRSDQIHGDIPRCLSLLITCYCHAGAVAEASREADRLILFGLPYSRPKAVAIQRAGLGSIHQWA